MSITKWTEGTRSGETSNSSYTPYTWSTGDTITAQKLNNMEQGIANAGSGSSGEVFYTTIVGTGYNAYSDKTCDVLLEALMSGKQVWVVFPNASSGDEWQLIVKFKLSTSGYLESIIINSGLMISSSGDQYGHLIWAD